MSSSIRGARVRIGDAERDAAASALGDHFAAGRLTREEFDERLEQAWAAKTADELDPLFVDLPRDRAAVQARRSEPVGFGDPRRRQVSPRRGRSGRPPVFLLLVVVAIVLTIITSVPLILIALGFLWFTGVLGHCGSARRQQWAHQR